MDGRTSSATPDRGLTYKVLTLFTFHFLIVFALIFRYHPDKNANDPKAADVFKEVTFSYNILSDPDKRRQYDTSGFEAIESESHELELDLSSLGAVNTMFAALFSKLGVPIKTTVSATILEEALNGAVTVRPLQLGQPLFRKVEKQCAHFYSVTLTEEQAQAGFVCRVLSTDRSKFKVFTKTILVVQGFFASFDECATKRQ
ncbi:Chaperone protein dnaJ 16 [Asimina triloba]